MVAGTPLAILAFGLMLSPGIPLVASWVRPSVDADERSSMAVRWVPTFSYLWLVAGALFPISLGPYYSNARFVIIYTNLLLMLICATIAFLRKSRLGALIGIASSMLAVVWFLVAALNTGI